MEEWEGVGKWSKRGEILGDVGVKVERGGGV